jgi:hypothetical protein
MMSELRGADADELRAQAPTAKPDYARLVTKDPKTGAERLKVVIYSGMSTNNGPGPYGDGPYGETVTPEEYDRQMAADVSTKTMADLREWLAGKDGVGGLLTNAKIEKLGEVKAGKQKDGWQRYATQVYKITAESGPVPGEKSRRVPWEVLMVIGAWEVDADARALLAGAGEASLVLMTGQNPNVIYSARNEADKAPAYRLALMDRCHTEYEEDPMLAQASYSSTQLDLVSSRGRVFYRNFARDAATFLTSVLNGETYEQIVSGMVHAKGVTNEGFPDRQYVARTKDLNGKGGRDGVYRFNERCGQAGGMTIWPSKLSTDGTIDHPKCLETKSCYDAKGYVSEYGSTTETFLQCNDKDNKLLFKLDKEVPGLTFD